MTTAPLQFITHCNDRHSYLDGVRQVLDGGCRWVQLRMKDATTRELLMAAREARQLCAAAGAVFIVDDRIDIALAVGADGVHLGQKDMPLDVARQLMGPDAIIGGTANTIAEICEHARHGADYIGCGPFRFTTTKQGLAPTLGLDGYQRLTAQMAAEGIDVPLVAIGGITPADIPALMASGASGIALSGAILNADDPAAETRKIINIIDHIQ